MTLAAYLGFGFITIFIIVIAVGIIIFLDGYKFGIILTSIVTIIILIIMWGVGFWYYNNTEGGKRAFKTQESNFNGGIERQVTVYDIEGGVVAEYKGKFDIEYDDDRILFDDENGLRHIIYYPTGTVIIDEIGE